MNTTLQTAFLDYFNNYLTVEKYAEHNQLTVEQAQKLIDLGREVHEDIVKLHKEIAAIPKI